MMPPTVLCVVTGASRGIGKAIARRFLQADHAVVAIGKNPQHMDAFVQQATPHGTVYPHVADLSDPTQATQAAQTILKHTQTIPLAVVVNNAGQFAGDALLDPTDQLPAQIHTNLYSAYYFTKPLLPYLVQRKQGHVFTMCSVASEQAYLGGASYCISKYALLGFAEMLRAELTPHGVRTTAILPGATWTDSWSASNLPPKRFISTQDIAELVWNAYALSPAAVVEHIRIRPQEGDI